MALSVQTIDRFIGQGNPLAQAGGARTLLQATGGNLAGAALLAAIARKESSFGKAAFAPNNFWGYGVHNGPDVNTAPSVGAMAAKVWHGLSGNLYRGAGLNTPSQILARYAPPSENNTALYTQQVNDWFGQMGLTPQTNVFSGQRASLPPQAPGRTGAGRSLGGAVAPAALPGLGRYLKQSEAAVLSGQMPGDVTGLLGSLDTVPVSLPPVQGRNLPAPVGGGIAGKAISAAESQLGRPYVWGAGGPGGPTTAVGHGTRPLTGFDCSSLVQYAFAKAGVNLPRTTYDQIHAGSAVANIRQARPGDLLFPNTGHVQIYAGNGRVIEAPHTGSVVKFSPAGSSYVAIRRVG